MFAKLVEQLTEAVSRRGFLQRMGQAAAAIGLVLAGVDVAKAVVAMCCDLCLPPSASCSGCTCQWCWTCPHTDGCVYSCNECYSGATGAWCNNRTSPAGCPRTAPGQTSGDDGCPPGHVTCSSVTLLSCGGGGGGGVGDPCFPKKNCP